jgi:hypothetical protein
MHFYQIEYTSRELLKFHACRLKKGPKFPVPSSLTASVPFAARPAD